MGIVRFLLALSVMLEHLKSSSQTKMLDGFIAVQIFFILSGFYIFKTLSENYSSSNIDITKTFQNLQLQRNQLEVQLFVCIVSILDQKLQR